MDTNKDIHARAAQQRVISAYTKRPNLAMIIDRGTAEVHDGLTCTYEQGGHSVCMDMPTAIGGDDQGPTPGYFGRAAICGCIAMGIKMTATRENLRIQSVRVGIEQDFDDRGILAMNGADAAPQDTRIIIEIVSQEAQNRVNEIVDTALAHDPWFLAFRDAQQVSTAVSVIEKVL